MTTLFKREKSTDSVGGSAAAAYRDVSKSFGRTAALSGVSLEIRRGTVHALVGENGAGKSTALGILAGRIGPTSGRVELFGELLTKADPRAVRRAGLAAIYQELTIVPTLDAVSNVYLGETLSRVGFLSTREMRCGYLELCEKVGVDAPPPSALAGTLPIAQQQILEILRAVRSESKLILFDEPTASLGASERRILLDLMARLRDGGTTMAFVSHNLDEVLEIADDVTVFRSGKVVATASRSKWDKPSVVRQMLGETEGLGLSQSLEAELLAGTAGGRPKSRKLDPDAPIALEVAELELPDAVENVSFSVRRGEILGLGGLVGSGRTSVLRSLAGLEAGSHGTLRLQGNEVSWPRNSTQARRYGIGLLPEDRKGQGLVLEMSGAMNLLMGRMNSVSRCGFIRDRYAEGVAAEAAEQFGFDRKRIGDPARQLSGGNQQKILLARWGYAAPDILLVDEPTRGIDIGAKEEVLSSLERMAAGGTAIIFVSSELEEVALVSDRVAVLSEGRLVRTLDAAEGEIAIEDILNSVFAVEAAR